jgi:beta-galactosidase
MYVGACYYPEHWPEERWPRDAMLMQEAGINVVRIGEFSWSKLERREGEYDFTWLDRSIAIMEASGIKVVLGTPTATPPKWLMDKYPDIYMRDNKGTVRGFGHRRHYCYNNTDYHRYAQLITTKLAERYGSHTSIIAWQIDNEFGCTDTTRCYCHNCRGAFQAWLRKKYEDIDRLNDSWGTVFWSQTYNGFNEIELPGYTVFPLHNPGMELDYRRFASDSVVDFQQQQISRIRKLAPNQPITHNLMGFFNEIDGFHLTKDLDFTSWDNYPNLQFAEKIDPRNAAIQHDMTWGLKRDNFWVMEHQVGAPGGNLIFAMPKPGELRRWTWQSVAHGADAIIYFRWRTCLFGAEQYWHGILPHDGEPGRRYKEVQQVGEELQRISGQFVGSHARAEVALIRSYDNEWAMEIQPQRIDHRYMGHFTKYYRYFYDRRIPVEVVSDAVDFSPYRVVVLPHYMLAQQETVDKLYRYVADGGTIVLDFRAGIKRWDNQMEASPLPGAYRQLLGIRITDYGSLRDWETRLASMVDSQTHDVIQAWYDIIELESAEPIAFYRDDFFAGTPAATRNGYGLGSAYYIGTEPQQELLEKLLDRVCLDAGVMPIRSVRAPAGVEITRRATELAEYIFVLNHEEYTLTISLDYPLYELITGRELEGEVELAGNDVLVFIDGRDQP